MSGRSLIFLISYTNLITSCHYREMVIVHPDADFLDDINGKLKEVPA